VSKTVRACLVLVFALSGTSLATAQKPASAASDDWPYYGHDPGGMRCSPLTQINRENVSQLQVAWTYHTGDISDGSGGRPRSGFETTPLLVDGTLYLTTGFNRVIALDPATGKERWAFDPKIDTTWDFGDGLINRGVASWLDTASNQLVCRRRIYEATLDARLISLDAATGEPCADFGKNGEVSLRDVADYWQGVYHVTSPPAVVDDVIVVGSAINDNMRANMPSGVVRAFNARTGTLLWKWDPIPPNVEAATGKSDSSAKVWRTGAANAWSVIVADPERQLFFVPTGSASPDMYGGLRPGDDKWADSVVALRARTGEVVWGFQLVHHNLWDYDTAAAPLLATFERDDKKIPVVIQGNKSGFVYVLNRDTGAPIFPIVERSVPKSDIPGEVASATQPFPSAPPALVPQHLTADEVWGITSADRDACRAQIKGMRTEGVFTPPSVQGTVTIPGHIGGMNWSGSAFEAQRGLLIVNTNNLPYIVRLIPRAEFDDPTHRNLPGEFGSQTGTPYAMYRIPFLAPGSHLPCSAPPWGTLAAVDIAAGKIRWQVPLGSMENFAGSHPGTPPGSISLGGPIVTAGGLVFIAGTIDPYLRAFDVETGKELWKGLLPASGHATPMTYRLPNGKQFVVIAAGGHAKISEEPQSDVLIAFALP
jgi:membrane-bound PQQ-dependent dehydrogenase (glucose/quinate/shikimate family)